MYIMVGLHTVYIYSHGSLADSPAFGARFASLHGVGKTAVIQSSDIEGTEM